MKAFIEIVLGIVGVVCFAALLWFGYQYTKPKGSLVPSTPSQTFPNTNTSGVSGQTTTDQQTSPFAPPEELGGANNRTQKIFKIANGPVAAAVFITTQPTSTVARYITQDSGHVFDQPIDVVGEHARTVSNTTIPGIARAFIATDGSAGLLQYEEGGVVKTVYIGLSTSTVIGTSRTSVRFLPNNIGALAISPDAKNVAYSITTTEGSDLYVATTDGSNPKKTASLPIQQTLLTWPSQLTLLTQTKAASGVPGMLLSVAVKNGTYTPLLYTKGLSALANTSFTKILYQTDTGDNIASYVHDTTSGKDVSISFTPIPQKCVWGGQNNTMLYCAAPAVPITYSYVDSWRAGTTRVSDALFTFNTSTGQSLAVASPGSSDGGVLSDILEMSVSPDGKYLLFITKGERSLWGVRLEQ